MQRAGTRVVGVWAGRTGDGWVADLAPVVSWQVESTSGGWVQCGAELELTHRAAVERPGAMGVPPGAGVQRATLTGGDRIALTWPFESLRAGERYDLRVRVHGPDSVPSPWSSRLTIHAPVMDLAVRESFVTVDDPNPDPDDAAPAQYRRMVTVTQVPVAARLTLTGFGVLRASINGVRVGDEELAPGWTAYADRVVHRGHDVTGLLRLGENTIEIWVAAGWYGERYGFFGRTARAYEGPLAVCARLECDLADGSRIVVGTDARWQGRTTGLPVTAASIYHGEEYDARRTETLAAQGDKSTADDGWRPCRELTVDPHRVTPATAPPVRTTQVLRPATVTRLPNGAHLVDVGANVVGVARLRVQGPAGHTVTLRFTEELHPDGTPAYGPLRTARATDRYTLRGNGVETWQPWFTFHGFRYVEVLDWPGGGDPDLDILVWHTDFARTGGFSCSSPLLTTLYENAARSLRGNLVSLPTDCPQRDERLGWTGDLQVFLPAAAGMYDVCGAIDSWLEDVACEQARLDGVVPVIVPNVLPAHDECVAGWGDVVVVGPWTLYERYGDLDVLRRRYPAMTAWVAAVLRRVDADMLWRKGLQIGDHLAPQASPTFPGTAPADTVLLAGAHLYRSLALIARTAELLGRQTDANRYSVLANRCREALLHEFVTPGGRVACDSITAYATLVTFGIAPRELWPAMGRRLASLVAELDHRIGTGFLGTPLIVPALVATDQPDAAARLLLQTSCPSWLYPVTQGATTIWERWDGKLPDGRINGEDMASFNHYALGAVADWLQTGLAGLAPAAPGYRQILVQPTPLPGITSARAWLDTPYGTAKVAWTVEGETLAVTALVPSGTTALVRLSDGERVVGPGRHRWTVPHRPPGDVREKGVGQVGVVSTETDLGTLVLDREAREVIVKALTEHAPHRAVPFAGGGIRWQEGVPLHAALMFVPDEAMTAVREGLAALSRGRTLARTAQQAV